MVIDVCTVNDEYDLWDIHYKVLEPYVDEFIVVQFTETFSGKKREWMPIDLIEYPKARNNIHSPETYEKYRALAESSPNTQGAEHWKREFMQKESIKDALTHLKDDDIVFIGDVDEVWNPELVGFNGPPTKLKLYVYTYWLNNRSNEEFWGTLVAKYKDIKDSCLNHLRSDSHKIDGYGGWHFTSMAPYLEKKLTDSYTQESYATPTVLSNLEYNISHGKDFLGRDFTYRIDTSQWPKYLKENAEKYQHLLKTTPSSTESTYPDTI